MESKKSTGPNRTAAMATAGLFGGLAVGIVAVAMPFVVPAFRKVVLPYVPATPTQIENVLNALRYRRPFEPPPSARSQVTKPKIIDLGSGDGRIVIACAHAGYPSHGVELNPWLVLYSKYRAFRENVNRLATFKRIDLFKVNLAEYDKIIVFGVESMMELIESKVRQDFDTAKQIDGSPRKATLIVCRFPLPNWKPYMSFGTGVDQVWLYRYEPDDNQSSPTP